MTCGTEFRAAAFDVELGAGAGPASLWLVDGGAERPVAEFDLATDPVVPPRILVDGSIVEIFDGGPAPYTTRAYPTATSGWVLRLASAAPVTAWRLGLPGDRRASSDPITGASPVERVDVLGGLIHEYHRAA